MLAHVSTISQQQGDAMNQLIHTPEGFRDIFGRQCDKKRYVERRIEKKFRSYGYQNIETPSMEFQDVFSREVGTTPERELYRLFDRDGNLLALRPDFTPSVARSVARYFAEETGPIRLCYSGSVFQNNSRYQGRLHETTQMGVELIGEDSAEADAEIIALTVQAMKEAGLTQFQVSIGHVDFFRALVEEAGLSDETAEQLRELLLAQNRFGAKEQIEKLNLRHDLQNAFESIPELFGDVSILDRVRKLTDNRRARRVCDRLRTICETLRVYGVEQYVTFDLGMLSAYQYYTGVVFRAYTYGTGDAIIKGGRYDSLLERYGKKSPAIGFTTEIDALLTALDRQGIEIPIRDMKTMVLYPRELEASCVRYAEHQRARGIDVACVRFDPDLRLDDYRSYGARNQFGGIIYFRSEQEVYAINIETGQTERLDTGKEDVR
jgi:ATP phosphoribosyltransferase regulatory subunit